MLEEYSGFFGGLLGGAISSPLIGYFIQIFQHKNEKDRELCKEAIQLAKAIQNNCEEIWGYSSVFGVPEIRNDLRDTFYAVTSRLFELNKIMKSMNYLRRAFTFYSFILRIEDSLMISKRPRPADEDYTNHCIDLIKIYDPNWDPIPYLDTHMPRRLMRDFWDKLEIKLRRV